MEENRFITLDMLEDLFKHVIEKLKFDKVNKVELDMDFYRQITADEWKNLGDSSIVIGSLVDDFDCLKKAVNIPYGFTYVDFDRTASLLRFVSEKLNPVNG